MTDERSQLRTTFNQVALLYDQVRPGYPEALFDDVVSLSEITPDGRTLKQIDNLGKIWEYQITVIW